MSYGASASGIRCRMISSLLGRLPVGGEVVLAAQPVVVDPGRVGMPGIELRQVIP
jgi:hypothetical protein